MVNEEQELTGAHLINGNWVSSGGAPFRAQNPKTGEVLPGEFHEAGTKEADEAFAAAVAAHRETRSLPGAKWSDLLEAIVAAIGRRETALIARAGLETALPEARLRGELARTTGQLALFARIAREGSWADAVIDTAEPERKPLPKPDIRRLLRPIGPVVVFDASNFPFAFGACGGDTASALAAGNPVIVKAHPGHPGTDELFASVIREAFEAVSLPSSLFALLQGAKTKIGTILTQHPQAEAVGFTGSQQGGRALFDQAAARLRPIPVYAEMGSVNPLVILPGALAERGDTIAHGLAASVTLGGGQFCTKPGLVFYIADEAGNRFASRLSEILSALPATTLLNAGIAKRFGASIASAKAAPGVETRIEGAVAATADANPALLEVEASIWRTSPALHEEMFGPAALLVRCRDVVELKDMLESLAGQLTGALHTGRNDAEETVRVLADLLESRVGRLIFNGYPTGVEVGYAMMHGGPYPATTAGGTTSVGASAIQRFARPVAYQDVPDALLPLALQNSNPLGITRRVNGALTQNPL